MNNTEVDYLQLFQDLPDLIRKWQSLDVDCESFIDFLKFGDISLWDVVVANQAFSFLPRAILRKRNGDIYEWKIKPYLRFFRDVLREFNEKLKAQEVINQRVNGNGRTKIMFLVFVPRQIAVLAPIIDLLLRDESFEIIVVGSRYEVWNREVLNKNIRYVEIEKFINSDILKQTQINRELLRSKWRILKNDKKFQDNIKYKGVSIWEKAKDNFLNLFIHTFPQLIKQIAIANTVLDKEKPDLIIGADNWDERARIYYLLSRKRCIPTLYVQYGHVSPTERWDFISADKAAIFDKRTCQSLIRQGADAKKLVVTGNPKFDDLIQKRGFRNDRNTDYNKLKIAPNSKVVLFTSQPNVAECFPSEKIRKELIATIYNAVCQMPGVVLIVKPHPGEEAKLHLKLKSKINSDSIIIAENNSNTHQLLLICDILISFHSTTVLEAIILDKPVIVYKIPDRLGAEHYFQKDCILEVSSKKEITSGLESIFANSDIAKNLKMARQNFFEEQGYADGLSSERICELALSMIKNNKTNI